MAAEDSLPASKTTTLAGSAAPSRAQSLSGEKTKEDILPHESSPAASTHQTQQETDLANARGKDRAPKFVVALCLFQSLAGLLFGYVRPRFARAGPNRPTSALT